MTQRFVMPPAVALLWLGAACTSATTSGNGSVNPALAVPVECSDPSSTQSSRWECPSAVTLDCADRAHPPTWVVTSPSGSACVADELTVTGLGSWTPGTRVALVHDASGAVLCSTQVTVVAQQPPSLQAHTIQLWPPNHKFHEIAVEDCVSIVDSCDEPLQAEFVWASSDEPVDSIGDGHFAPDILLADDCQHVSVRSERQGPDNGRVYRLGVRVVDHAGNVSEAVCQVIVDHDQSGAVGADSGEAYRLTFDGTQGGPSCDGQPPPPPSEPPPVTRAPEAPL
jgi:hypothetical protein